MQMVTSVNTEHTSLRHECCVNAYRAPKITLPLSENFTPHVNLYEYRIHYHHVINARETFCIALSVICSIILLTGFSLFSTY